MKYNPFSLAIATFFLALALMYSITSIANAYEQVVYENIYEPYPEFDDACQGLCGTSFINTLDSFPYLNGWSWWTFIYSSSTTRTIDNISFAGRVFYKDGVQVTNNGIEESVTARWEVYRTIATTSVGDLIGYTNYNEINELDYDNGLTRTYKWYFNTPITIGGAYYYRFVLQAEQGASISFYMSNATTDEDVWVQNCLNEYAVFGEPIDDCENNFNDYRTFPTYVFRKPVVKLSYGGVPTSGEYVTTYAPCQTDSKDIPNASCNSSVPLTEVSIGGFANLETQNKKVSIYLRDKFLNTLDSVAFYYTTAGYYNFEQTFYELDASTTYNILTCISDAESFPTFAVNPVCTTIIYTNGDNPVSYEQYWCEMFPNEPSCLNATSSPPKLWTELGCDDVGITDVKKGVQCGLVWAFEPSQNSIQQFERAKNAILYSIPIGYATYMVEDIKNAFTSTSTSVFTREIELGKYFGKPDTATTTISLEGMTSYFGIMQPFFDLIEKILWLAFAVWFIYWALTRTL